MSLLDSVEISWHRADFKDGKLPEVGQEFYQQFFGQRTKFVVTENNGNIIMSKVVSR